MIAGGVDSTNNLTRSTELLNPATGVISLGGSYLTPRTDASAVTLSNSWVLSCGGNGAATTAIASCEIFNPTLGFWVPGAIMSTARDGQTLTPLSAGQALVTGGVDSTGAVLGSSAIYTIGPLLRPSPAPPIPSEGTWAAAGNLNTARSRGIAIKLKTGDVLLFGGQDGAGNPLASSELFSATTKNWTATGSLSTARFAHAGVLLKDGRVLLVGGLDSGGLPIAQTEIYDPVAKIWSLGPTLSFARSYPSVALQKNNFAWINGGFDAGGVPVPTTEVFDTGANTLTNDLALDIPRGKHTSLSLTTGIIWLGSGLDGSVLPTYQSEAYDSAAATISLLGNNLAFRKSHTISFVPTTNQVFIAGGADSLGNIIATTQIFDVASGSIDVGATMRTARALHTATSLNDGRILYTGGQGTLISYLTSTEVYAPSTTSFASVGSMVLGRRNHQAVLLVDGRVLAFGGRYTSGVTATSEIYDPKSNAWSATGIMSVPRADAASLLMPDGRVWVTGGVNNAGASVSSTEIYNPATGTWSAGPTLSVARSLHQMKISQGIVWVVAGLASGAVASGTVETATLPITGGSTFTPGPTLNFPRSTFSLQVLGSGVLIASGGTGGAGVNASSEIIASPTASWAAAGAFNSARNLPQSVLLADDRVFFEGGEAVTTSSTAEIFSTYTPIPITTNLGLSPFVFSLLAGKGIVYGQQLNSLIPTSSASTIQVQVKDQLGDTSSITFTFN